jgi:hypothetical protein
MSAPVIIAPIMLVATNSIAKRITEVRIVPRIPVNRVGTMEHTQRLIPDIRICAAESRVNPRNATAIPKTTQRNIGVRVITAVILRNAAIMPMIILATIARPAQLHLQSQPHLDICYSPPITIYSQTI